MDTNVMAVGAAYAPGTLTRDRDAVPARAVRTTTAPVFRFAVQWTEPWSRTTAGEPVVEEVGAYLTRDAAMVAFGEELRRHVATVGDGWRLRVVDLADRNALTGVAATVDAPGVSA